MSVATVLRTTGKLPRRGRPTPPIDGLRRRCRQNALETTGGPAEVVHGAVIAVEQVGCSEPVPQQVPRNGDPVLLSERRMREALETHRPNEGKSKWVAAAIHRDVKARNVDRNCRLDSERQELAEGLNESDSKLAHFGHCRTHSMVIGQAVLPTVAKAAWRISY